MEDEAMRVVQRQVDLYNQRDVDQFVTIFEEDAQVIDGWTGQVLAQGIGEIRARYEKRFQTPVHCQLVGRLVLGNVVVDREIISGLPDGFNGQCLAQYTVNVQTARIIKCVLFLGPPGAS